MVSTASATTMALSFEEAVELPHFEKTSFRVNKKIFATLDTVNHRICVKLSKIHQSVFSEIDSAMIYPVPGKWGLQGATYAELKRIKKDVLEELLTLSYCAVAPKRLAMKYTITDPMPPQ